MERKRTEFNVSRERGSGLSSYDVWCDTERVPESRLPAFHAWLTEQLATRLQWPGNAEAQERQVGQCKRFVLGFVCDLRDRGWLFDGPKLAKLITEELDDVAMRQRRGEVRNLFPYLRNIFRKYAGEKAEELREDSINLGCHIGQLTKRLEARRTMPELVAQEHEERLVDRLARERKRKAAKAAEEKQGRFL